MAAARASSGGIAMCYVLLVECIASCLHTMARDRRCENGARILKLTHQEAAADRGRSLISTTVIET